MLRLRTTLVLLLACAACGALLWVLHRTPARPLAGQVAGRLLPPSAADAAYLLVERGDLRIELRREPGGWMLTEPVSARADDTAVQRLLDACDRAPLSETLTADELALRELSLSDFGLLVPQARLVLAGSQFRAELLLGIPSPVGGGLFVGLAQSGDVQVTDRALLDALPASVNDLRDQAFYRGNVRRLVGLALRRPGAPYVRLVREGRAWRITQPIVARAEHDAVKAIFDALLAARVAQFVWPPPFTNDVTAALSRRADWVGFGLDGEETGVQLQIWEAGDPAGSRFRLGGPAAGLPGHVYALTADELSVVAITNSLLEALAQPLERLRDLRLFADLPGQVNVLELRDGLRATALHRGEEGAWQLTLPVSAPADPPAVARLIEDLLLLRATTVVDGGEAVTALASNVAARIDVATSREPRRLLLGHPAPGSPVAPLAFTNGAAVYFVATSRLETVLAALQAPASLRHPGILAAPAASIRRLAVRRGARVEVVTHDAGDQWRPPPGVPLDRPALDAWTAWLADVRANRIVSLQPEGLAPFGLLEPPLELEIDLGGVDSLRRVLCIGELAPSGGRYALLRGDDTVFELPPPVTPLLARPILLPATPPDPGPPPSTPTPAP